MTDLESLILKELDKQRIKANVISIIMNKLKSNEMKNKFLDFMMDNRTVLLNEVDLFVYLRKISDS